MASSVDEQVLRAAKEIVVKFIETGRVSPTAFPEVFNAVYTTIFEAVHRPREAADDASNDAV
ncbi:MULTISPECIES: hypothetical protein [Desulfococcus]|jgi:hypothetical protein|uniref:Conjugal transfer protein TraB n=1 Tax=Desulfococcus multivorans DSM 2059 TaxID=1121405 RepID=S7V3H5_DESML|nr:hypothetical protein [Desulfococcus multivorans]AOY60282.1 conserved uncharacterized protein [Desulfococcus multivorans]AQV02393.1 hypothetical protein B2D07_17550 [Desulfococcus multivorans]EPR39208.1 hypothetical protein dsmv_2712 [Desulfococcus multivorans DSM 2059]MDX9819699.1 hypothetical protein [Desulfococcus multivorans]SJZ57847.1 hypothetical protein SAMN02745446_00980 [Desulfococcus multivorans DSM 2059]